MRVQIVCAVSDEAGAGPERLASAFPGTLRQRGGTVPSAVIGGATPLRDVVKRYDGAAPYSGPGPAHIWVLSLPVKDRVADPKRMEELCMTLHAEGKLIDLEVSVAQDDDLVPEEPAT